jgi:hypothetical protein
LEPSSADGKSRRQAQLRALLDRCALFGLAAGLAAYVLPFWPEGRLRVAFWLTLASTLLHVYTSHQQTIDVDADADADADASAGPSEGGGPDA